MVFAGLSYPARWYAEGLRVMTTTYPIKAPLLRDHQGDQLPAERADADGGEGEGVRQRRVHRRGGERRRELEHERRVRDGRSVLVHPKFDHILAGCTSLRLLELARALHGQGVLAGVEVRDIPVAEARASREMLLSGAP